MTKTIYDRLGESSEIGPTAPARPEKIPMKAQLNIAFEGSFADFIAWAQATFKDPTNIQIKVTSGQIPTALPGVSTASNPDVKTPADFLVDLVSKTAKTKSLTRSEANDIIISARISGASKGEYISDTTGLSRVKADAFVKEFLR